MFLNETICVLESDYSGQEVQDLETWSAIGITLVLVLVAALGFVIKGFFIYYIKYEAPKERPINTMILAKRSSKSTKRQIIQMITHLDFSIYRQAK